MLTFTNRLIQLHNTIDGPDGYLRRDLNEAFVGDDTVTVRLGCLLDGNFLTLVGDDTIAIRFGGLLDGNLLALVGNDTVAVRFGGVLDRNILTLVGDDPVAVRLGCLLDGNLLTFVGDDPVTVGFGGILDRNVLAFVWGDGNTIGFGGYLNGNILALKAPFNSNLERSLGEPKRGGRQGMGRTAIGMGMAETWPTRKREKKKARTAEGEKNIVTGRRKVGGLRLVGCGGAER